MTDHQAYFAAEQDGEIVEWTAGDLLRHIAAAVPDVIALKELRDPVTGRQRSWTYSQLQAEAERAAQLLLRHFAPGDRVALWAANQPEWIFLQFGAALAGLVLVTINPASRLLELEHALQLGDVAGIFLARKFRDIDAEAIVTALQPKLPGMAKIFILDDWADYAWPDAVLPLPAVAPGDAAMLQFTSGTTGKAKAAMLSHRGLVNIAQFTAARFALPLGSVWLCWLPLFHTGGCVFAIMSAMWNRGTTVLMSGFEPKLFMQTVAAERPRWTTLVPTTAVAILDHPERADYDLSSLEVIVQGGTPVAPDLVRRIERELQVDYMMVFGQTETSSTICLTLRNDTQQHKTATVGKPMPYTEIRIADPQTGAVLRHGEAGEIQVRNVAMMLGYFGQPEATASAIDADGWLHTGDLGVMAPDGYLSITGRLKDLIIRGGENIYPREIEDVLAAHPGIAEVSIFGVPDARWGEKLVAAIRPRPPHEIDLATVQKYLTPLIARHKIPQAVWLVESMPITLSGKVQKFALRDAFLKSEAKA